MLNNYLQYHIINSLYICSGIITLQWPASAWGPCHETSMTSHPTCRPVGGPAMVPWLMSMSLWGGLYNYIYVCICNMYILYIYICVYTVYIYTILCMTYYFCDVRMTHAHQWNKSRLFSPLLSFSQLVSDLLRFSARLHSALLSFLNVCATHVSLLSFLWSSQSALVYVTFFLSFQEEV